MLNLLRSLLFAGLAFFKTRRQLAVEVLALRHQLGVLKRLLKRPRLSNVDRRLWGDHIVAQQLERIAHTDRERDPLSNEV